MTRSEVLTVTATDQAGRLATPLGMDLMGYARSPKHLVIYTRSGRILT